MNEQTLVFLDAASIGDDISWPDFSTYGQVVRHDFSSPDQVSARIRSADMVFTNKAVLKAEHIEAAERLRYVGVLATGYNQVDLEACKRRGIPVCNVPDYSSPSVVQHVFTLMFALASHLCPLAASVRAGAWAKSGRFSYWDKPLMELEGKIMGVVGFGDIGSHVAKAAHGFGMDVLAYAPRPKPAPSYLPFAFTSLEDLFARADVVSLHCPLTSETKGLINGPLLKAMKKSALLINTARGPLVNEADLAQALKDGEIAGAGLDVVSREPMPDDNPLREAPNCLITPHVAWSSTESRTRLMEGAHANVKHFMAGQPRNVVNGV